MDMWIDAVARWTCPAGRCAAALIVIGSLIGCDDAFGPGHYVERAREYRAAGDVQASLIELKNALREQPDNGEARLLLAEIHLQLDDPLSAEKELVRAQDLGIARERIVEPLGSAWLRMGKYDAILDGLLVDQDTPPGVAASVMVLRGRAHVSRGITEKNPQQLIAARQAFERALELDPDAVGAVIGLGRVALSVGDLQGAQDRLDVAQRAAADDPDTLALAGDLALVQGEIPTAEASFERLVGVKPNDPIAHLALGRARLSNGKPAEAIKPLDLVLSVLPKHPVANYLRAVASYETGDYAAAQLHAETVIAVSPDDQPSILIAGASSYALGQLERAHRYLTGYVAQSPQNAEAQELLAATRQRLDSPSAESSTGFQPISEARAAEDAGLLAAVGTAALRLGEQAVRLSDLKKAVEQRPDDAAAISRLGISRIALGQRDEGIEELKRALEVDPKNLIAAANLFKAYLDAGDHDSAREVALALQRALPGNPVGFSLEGVALGAKGDLEGAKLAFGKALEVSPGNPDASANLASILVSEGRFDNARALYDQALAANPGHYQTMMKLAELEGRAGRPEQLLEWLRKTIAAHPDALQPRLTLARYHVIKNEPLKALSVTSGVPEQLAKTPALLEVVGRAQLMSGAVAEATGTFETLVKLLPESTDAHLSLAQAYEQAGNDTKLKPQLEELLRLDPAHVPGRFAMARLLVRSGELDAAGGILGELEPAVGDSSMIPELKGQIAVAQGRLEEGIEQLRQAHERRQTNLLLVQLADAHRQAGQTEEAVKLLRGWLEQYPSDLLAQLYLASLHLSLGQWEQAERGYAAAVELDADNVLALNNRAFASLQLGRPAEALASAAQAFELAPQSPDVLDTYGQALLANGRSADAIQPLREAIEKRPDLQEARFRLAQALVQEGDRAEAQSVLRDLLASEQPFTQRAEAQALLEQLQ